MCVIAIVHDQRPSEMAIEAMWDTNDDGGGVAWFDEGVHWKKGLTLDEMKEAIATLPVPFTAHFRIASCGGESRRLTHPFIISPDSPLEMEGVIPVGSEKTILFHNGHIADWEQKFLVLAGTAGYRLPGGKYSDTRAMAVAAAHYGEGILEFHSAQRFVVMTPAGEIRIFGNGWTTWRSLFLTSNTHWEGRFLAKERTFRQFLEAQGDSPEAPAGASVVGPITPQLIGTTTAPAATENPSAVMALVTTTGAGGPRAVDPFGGKPLSHFEELRKKGQLSKNGLKRIRKGFEAIARREKKWGKKPTLSSDSTVGQFGAH